MLFLKVPLIVKAGPSRLMAALIIATAPSLPLSFIFMIIVMIIIITMLAQSAAFLVSDFRSRLCDEGVGQWVPSAFKNPSVPTEQAF